MINWGVLGLGNMGRQFINCFVKSTSQINLNGAASKSKTKLDLLKNKINFQYYDSYESLINSANIDAIYIATLNNTHKDLAISAINNDKKILCEKPTGLNHKEVCDLQNVLKNKKNSFYEAIAYRSHPQTMFLMDLLKDKEIGKIKKIESFFGFKIKKIDKNSRLFNKELGGGSILDLGCYPISFFNLFNSQDNEMKIQESKVNLCETSVDIDAEIFLDINEDIKAFGKVSLKENLKNICRIYCENGIITIPHPWLPPEKTFIEIETKSRYHKNIINSDKNVYSHQVKKVSEAFMNKENNFLVDINESLQISKIIDTWLKN